MLGKIQGMFKKVQHNFNTADEAHRDKSYPHHLPRNSQPSSPQKKPGYRSTMTTDARPNPLARPQRARPPQYALDGGASSRTVSTSQVNASPLSPLTRADAVSDNDRPRSGNGNTGGAAPPPRQAPPQQSSPDAKPLPQYTAYNPDTKQTLPEATNPKSPYHTTAARASQEPPVRRDANAKPALTQSTDDRNGFMQYSAISRIVTECGLSMEDSGDGNYRAATTTTETSKVLPGPSTAAPGFTAPHSPPAPPPPRVPPSALPAEDATRRPDRRYSRQSSSEYDYVARRSDEYDTAARRTSPDAKTRVSDDYDDVMNLLMANPIPETKLNKPQGSAYTQRDTVTLAAVAKKPSPERGPYSTFKPFNNADSDKPGDNLERDVSSGDYDMGYTYVNRPVNSASMKSNDTRIQRSYDDGLNGFLSRVTQRRVSETTTHRFDNDNNKGTAATSSTKPTTTTSTARRHSNELSRHDNSSSLIGPSKLRRANDLALSQWKYVAMVVKKVAEKKTLVRQSRVKAERRPSLLAAQGLSVMPLERRGSAKSNDSVVFAPEEERPEEDGSDVDTEVSVYDDRGKPLLIPNLSDLFSDARSGTASDTSSVFDASESSNDTETDPHQPASNAPSGRCSNTPEPQSPQKLPGEQASPPTQSRNDFNGAMLRRNQQQQNYARAQIQGYRQKMIQQQRQQLLLQQQRMQQQNFPQPYHPSSPNHLYNPNGHAGVTPCSNNPGLNTTMLPKLTKGTTGRPWPQPDIRFGPRLTAGRSRYVDITAITGMRLEDARVINSPNWAALEPPPRKVF
jgi:hypothetical protein